MRAALWLFLLAGCDVIWDLDHVERTDLAAYFPLDEVTPDNHVVDLVGEADGVCTGSQCPTAIAGVVDGALLFNGTSSLVRSPSSSVIDTKGSFTLSVWVRIDAAPPGTDNACAINKLLGPNNLNTWQLCAIETDWNLFTGTLVGGIKTTQGPATDIGNWHQFAVTWASDTLEMRLYYDGVVVGIPEKRDLDFDSGQILIGADSDNAQVGGWFRGAVDEFRIYSRTLTDNEVAALYSDAF